MWADHYKSIFICLEYDTESVQSIHDQLLDSTKYQDLFVEPLKISDAIRSLSGGKSPGLDRISPEHIKYSSDYLLKPLNVLFTSMFVHGYMPAEIMKNCIVPNFKK